MTTVAYKDGTMACDSAWSEDMGLLTRRPKIIRLQSGGLLGEAGACDTRDVIALLDKVKRPSQLPTRKQLIDIKLDYCGLLVLPMGKIFTVFMDMPGTDDGNWDGGVFEVGENYYAVGSGRKYAFAIMEEGGTAKRAVEIACRRDMNSRPPVHTAMLPARMKPNGRG